MFSMNRYILLSYTVLTNMIETIQVLFCKTNHKCTMWKCKELFHSKTLLNIMLVSRASRICQFMP